MRHRTLFSDNRTPKQHGLYESSIWEAWTGYAMPFSELAFGREEGQSDAMKDCEVFLGRQCVYSGDGKKKRELRRRGITYIAVSVKSRVTGPDVGSWQWPSGKSSWVLFRRISSETPTILIVRDNRHHLHDC